MAPVSYPGFALPAAQTEPVDLVGEGGMCTMPADFDKSTRTGRTVRPPGRFEDFVLTCELFLLFYYESGG